jgi:hypothetical protein
VRRADGGRGKPWLKDEQGRETREHNTGCWLNKESRPTPVVICTASVNQWDCFPLPRGDLHVTEEMQG